MRSLAFLSFLPILFLGCNDAPKKQEVHAVHGVVQYDGKPVSGVQVYLMPVQAPGVPQIPHNPMGVTKEDGSFQLGTYGDADGAPEGEYKLTLIWPKPPAEGERKETQDPADADRLQGWYDYAHSPITVKVKAGENAIPTIKIPLITKPATELKGIPGKN